MSGGASAGPFVATGCTDACWAAVTLSRKKKAKAGPVIRKARMTIGPFYQDLANKRGGNRIGAGDGRRGPTKNRTQNPIPTWGEGVPSLSALIVSVYHRSGTVRTAGDWGCSPGGRNALRASVLQDVPILLEIEHGLAAVFRRTQSARGSREHHVVSQLGIGTWLENIAGAQARLGIRARFRHRHPQSTVVINAQSALFFNTLE